MERPLRRPIVELPPLVRSGVFVVLVATSLALIGASAYFRDRSSSPYPMSLPVPVRASVLSDLGVGHQLWAKVPLPVVEEFRRGDTVQTVLERIGLEPEMAYRAAEEAIKYLDPRSLRAGDDYTVFVDDEKRPVAVSWGVKDRGRVWLRQVGDHWQSQWQTFERVTKRRMIAGRLNGALETSIEEAGGHPLLSTAMADVLQWDLDFNRDLRLDDGFYVLYDEVWIDGRFHQVEGVEALVYENQGRLLEAYRFDDDSEGGYYDASGRPLRRQFLRSPLKYSRVTSRFTNRRFHPVLKVYRPHYGVDYGAPVGTSVRVTGNGVVSWTGWDKGGGRTVKVRHPNGYESAYLHLSKFGAGITRGKAVKQGDVIAYVGKTGLATGPHLDYRMKRNGRYIDPLSLHREDIPVKPISNEKIAQFEGQRDALRATLELPYSTAELGDTNKSMTHPAEDTRSSAMTATAGDGD